MNREPTSEFDRQAWQPYRSVIAPTRPEPPHRVYELDDDREPKHEDGDDE